MQKSGRWLLALWMLAPLAAAAETAYVVDRLQVGLRAARDGNVIKHLESGALLDVLERDERFARVRDKQGTEGWLELRYLGSEPPARAQLAKLQEELNKARAQLADTTAANKDAGAGMPSAAAHAGESPEWDYLWFAVSGAMLIVGFVVGIVWHRESIRRRMGGMYLKI